MRKKTNKEKQISTQQNEKQIKSINTIELSNFIVLNPTKNDISLLEKCSKSIYINSYNPLMNCISFSKNNNNIIIDTINDITKKPISVNNLIKLFNNENQIEI